MPRLLMLGGMTTAYHNFAEMGPVITAALTPAGFTVDPTEDLDTLSGENLKGYDGVLNYTTARDLTDGQLAALLDFVRGGGGYIGIHNATDTFKNQPDAIALIGGIFVTHPEQLDVPVEILDTNHPVTRGVPPFTVHDELYVMNTFADTYTLLAETHAHETQPIAWVREEGAGRVFYLSLGHNAEVFQDDGYLKLLRRGTQWAIGQEPSA